jgi:hypothetical protein
MPVFVCVSHEDLNMTDSNFRVVLYRGDRDEVGYMENPYAEGGDRIVDFLWTTDIRDRMVFPPEWFAVVMDHMGAAEATQPWLFDIEPDQAEPTMWKMRPARA